MPTQVHATRIAQNSKLAGFCTQAPAVAPAAARPAADVAEVELVLERGGQRRAGGARVLIGCVLSEVHSGAQTTGLSCVRLV